MIEVEIKLKINSIPPVLESLKTLGFKELSTLTEIDTYFDSKPGTVRANDQALRIRETKNHTTGEHFCQVNFKDRKINSESVTRPEFETLVDDALAIKQILGGLGYFPVEPIVKKLRRELISGEINACLDTVEGLGDYLELEIVGDFSEEEIDEKLKVLSGIVKDVGYDMSDTTTISYLSALQILSGDGPYLLGTVLMAHTDYN